VEINEVLLMSLSKLLPQVALGAGRGYSDPAVASRHPLSIRSFNALYQTAYGLSRGHYDSLLCVEPVYVESVQAPDRSLGRTPEAVAKARIREPVCPIEGPHSLAKHAQLVTSGRIVEGEKDTQVIHRQ
jgi:hypothetical protein